MSGSLAKVRLHEASVDLAKIQAGYSIAIQKGRKMPTTPSSPAEGDLPIKQLCNSPKKSVDVTIKLQTFPLCYNQKILRLSIVVMNAQFASGTLDLACSQGLRDGRLSC